MMDYYTLLQNVPLDNRILNFKTLFDKSVLDKILSKELDTLNLAKKLMKKH